MTGFPEVAVVGFGQSPQVRETTGTTNGVEMLVPVFQRLLAETGLSRREVGFWCSGSSDYLAGRAFSFVTAVDAIGALPPIAESHVEGDAAWALYEAWLKIRMGEAETALVYGFGKSSAGDLRRVLALQLDPYLVAPLWPDSVSIAALQARVGIEAGLWSEKEMAEVAARSRADGVANPSAQLREPLDPAALLDAPYLADPLRAHDCAPITDGAAAIVLAAGHLAADLCERPAWITGLEHRVDSPCSAPAISAGPRPPGPPRPPPASTASRWPSSPPRSPRRSCCCAASWGWPTTWRSTRPVARCAATRCSPAAWSGSARPPPGCSTAVPGGCSPTPATDRCCSRT